MRIFIGYESRYPQAYEVCKASIERWNKGHDIQPIKKDEMIKLGYHRPAQGESTEFAFTRFLVPYLCNYTGYALFCDGDFLWRSDPQEICNWKQNQYAIHVVKHPQLVVNEHHKMDGKVNRPYDKKYWSSLMYMDCSKAKNLTIESVNHADASDLHGFKWLKSDNEIGELPVTFNTLVGYYDIKEPKAVHFTDGGPWLLGYENVEYADEWKTIYNNL